MIKMKFYQKFVTLFVVLLATAVYSQEIIYPKLPFDQTASKNALEKGKSTISGFVFYAPKGGYGIKSVNQRTYGKYVMVSLFPLTAYIAEWNQLKNRWGKKKIVKMSKEADAMRIDIKADEGGNFTFTEMKPGKYLLLSRIDFYLPATALFPEESFYKDLQTTVEIKTDGETLTKIKVTN